MTCETLIPFLPPPTADSTLHNFISYRRVTEKKKKKKMLAKNQKTDIRRRVSSLKNIYYRENKIELL